MRRTLALLAVPMLGLVLSACSNPEDAYTPVDELPSAEPAEANDEAVADPAVTPVQPVPETPPPALPEAPPES